MNIDSINNGFVIDHIKAGQALTLYKLLNLEALDCSVAIIKNATSKQMGKKDIIKIDDEFDLNWDILGYTDPDVTINIIKNGVLIDKIHPSLPEKLIEVIQCKNPRCITTIEQEIQHTFKLTDRAKRIYRCIYCETKAK